MQKRIFKTILAVFLLAAMLFGMAMPLQQTYAVASGTTVGTGNQAYPTVKNVIMMIPDGMNTGASTLARYMLDEKGDVPLNMDEYLCAMVKTRWANGPITDSAPAATAYATGSKSVSGALGVDAQLLPRATILEAAKLQGKATGLVATSEFMHATPAAFSSHDAKRSNYAAIAEQMLNQKIDIFLGTGSAKLDKNVLDVVATAKAKGYNILENRASLAKINADSGKVWGDFTATIGGKNNMSYDLDRDKTNEPSLAEMTNKSIELLSKDKDGFFLMVEGSKIDWAAHANDTVGIATETLAFDQAVKEAVAFAKKDGNTMVVIMTDHGNSGMTIGCSSASAAYDKDGFSILAPIRGASKTAEGAMKLVDSAKSAASLDNALKAYGIDPADKTIAAEIAAFKADPTTDKLVKTMNKKCAIGYTTAGHTGEDVPLYVYAPANIKVPTGVVDNTAVADFVSKSLGLDLQEATKKLFWDVTALGTLDTKTNGFSFTSNAGKMVKIKLNQSVALVDGVLTDLEGQVAVSINGKVFVPAKLADVSKKMLSLAARYDTGLTNKDGGVAEIVKYNADNKKFYVVNGTSKMLDIVDLSQTIGAGGVTNLKAEKSINIEKLIKEADQGFVYGDLTSVDVDIKNDVIAVAVQAKDYDKAGKIVLLSYDGKLVRLLEAGVQPDMLTFTPDGQYLLAANEGEPRQGYGKAATDPKGSVTLISMKDGAKSATASNIDFTSFDSMRSKLVSENNVILKKNTNPSVDLEPEYIAVSADSKTAYVALQEANAIATLDIADKRFKSIQGLGFKDHGLIKNALDIYRDGKINIKAEAGFMGIYMPDGITTFEQNGRTYLLTANEGDSRDWNGYINEKDITLSQTGQDGINPGKAIKLTTFDTSDYDAAFSPDKKYLFGARSFAIWDASTMKLVYESGNTMESVTAARYPANFNWSNDDSVMDKRSAKKGPEPEDIKVGYVGGKAYAFVGLERIGGVMAFDLSSLNEVKFADYINTRDFSDKIKGDVAPEGLCFIPAKDSATKEAMLLTANEVSGTVSVYIIK